MSIADLLVIGVVLTFLGFIVWANVHHRKQMLRERKAAAARNLGTRSKAEARRG